MKSRLGVGPHPGSQAKFGIEQLDHWLQGLHWGENVVWVLAPDVDDTAMSLAVLRAAKENGRSTELLCIAADSAVNDGAVELGYGLLDIPQMTERTTTSWTDEVSSPTIIAVHLASPVPYEMSQLTAIARGALESGAVAHWFVTGQRGADEFLPLLELAQVVLRLSSGRLVIERADARGPGILGASLRLDSSGGTALSIAPPTAASRLGRGLAAIRQERGWNQSELAQIAGVSASAISQAENGRHALSLDTLLDLSSKLGITLDRIVRGRAQNYTLRRSDRRMAPTWTQVDPADSDHRGTRAMVVHLSPLESIRPMHDADSDVLLMVGAGLVQVSVGDDRLVLRAGDALSAPAGVANVHNLTDRRSVVFMVLSHK